MRRHPIFALFCEAALLVACAVPARAEPPALVVPTPAPVLALDTRIAEVAPVPASESTSYRRQIVLADMAGASALLIGARSGLGDHFRAVGFGAYALGAPIIHAANGHGWRAAGSFALRVGLPLAGAYLGNAAMTEDCPPDANLCNDAVPQFGIVIGAGLGVLTAIVVDTWLLARPESSRQPRWAPTATATPDGGTVGVSGRF